MKCFFSNHRNRGLTLPEVLVIIAGLFILAVLFLPLLASLVREHRPSGISCISQLKQVNLALLIWAEDNNNEYPMAISVTNGGGKEFIASGDVAGCLRGLSNEMSTTKIFICPQDKLHVYATNFGNDFNNSHISYFFDADVSHAGSPQMILAGDDNIAINGSPIKSGLAPILTNALVTWEAGRHGDDSSSFHKASPQDFFGYIGFADGSVQGLSSSTLQQVLEETGVATNRLAIP